MKWNAAPLAALGAALVALLVLTVSAATAADPTTVTVSSTVVGSLSTKISTNDVWSGEIGQYAASKSNFAALALPLVRLHIGDDGGAPAMPEIKQNQWSFTNLDGLVNDVTSTGQQPVMNIKFAPDWMWTCTTYQAKGTIKDLTFQTFADYMARLVSYYNLGSMTTEQGTVITNPKGTANHITYWELWNEPDLSNETPCSANQGSLTPAQYVTMWNAVTAAMLAVDPTLKFIGPATAGGQFGSATAGAQNDYVTQLMTNGNVKPYAISFHGYGYWDNTVSDKTIFDGDGSGGGCSCGGVVDMYNAAQAIGQTYPGYPLWITEVNVNADWGADSNNRPSGALGAAWWGSMYAELAPLNVALLHQYDVMDGPQFGLINDSNGKPYLPYWEVKTLNDAFPFGSSRLQVSSPDPQIQLLAAQRPDGKVSILVVNRRLLNNSSKTGVGSPASLVVSLSGINPTSVQLQQIDANTSVTTGPVPQSLDPSQPLTLNFPGYGFAVLTLTTGTPPPAPTLTGFSPSSGSAGASVTLNGTNLSGASSVALHGTNATFSVVSDSQLTATVPAGATSGTWSVTTAGGTATSSSSFTVNASAPTVTSFNPTNGPTGTSVTLTGTGFTGATAVKLNGTTATFTVNSATQISTSVPAGATTGKWAVTTAAGTGQSSGSFTVAAAPTLTSFTPTTGPVGTPVTLTGTNLTGATAVKLNGTTATFTVVSATSITTSVPSGASSGTWSVTTPGGTATSSSSFSVTASPPTLTSFNPTSGPVAANVTLTGTSLTGATSVKLNGTTASYTVNSATKITATVPNGATSGTWSVTTPGGSATSAGSFTVTATPPPPTVSGFSPTSGPAGTDVTITGTNLTNATSVKLAGTAASYTVDSATQITATVPNGASTGKWSVTTPGGSVTSSGSFTVTAPPAPTISSFLPASGPVGTPVTLTGTGFTGATSVALNGVAATYTVVSSTQILTSVPVGATSGPWSVTTAGGTAQSASFDVTASDGGGGGGGGGGGTPDLSVGISATATETPDVGAGLDYYVTVSTSVATATQAVLTVTLPAGYAATSVQPDRGTCGPVAAGTVVCTIPFVTPSTTSHVLITGTVTQAGELDLTASVASPIEGDSNPRNNTQTLQLLPPGSTATVGGGTGTGTKTTAKALKLAKAPVISGSAVVGKTVHGSAGTWSTKPLVVMYRWQLCGPHTCNALMKEHKSALKLKPSYAGKRIRLVVYASAGGPMLKVKSKYVLVRKH